MANEQNDRVFAIWDATTGTATARTILRTKTGPWDPLAEEVDGRPVDTLDYASATEGWTLVVGDFPHVNLPNLNPGDIPKDPVFTINTTTGVVTNTLTNQPISRRQQRVLQILDQRRRRWKDRAGVLTSRISVASFPVVREFLRKIDEDVTADANWATAPETLLTNASYDEPSGTTEEATPLVGRLPGLFNLGSILRDKFASRATYDFIQDLKLGPFFVSASDVEIAKIDLGALPRGNIYAISYSFDFRSPTAGNPVTVKLQSRAAEIGGALSLYSTDYAPVSTSTTYSHRQVTYVFGGAWDDVEFRLVWNAASANGVIAALKNVSIVATRLTISE